MLVFLKGKSENYLRVSISNIISYSVIYDDMFKHVIYAKVKFSGVSCNILEQLTMLQLAKRKSRVVKSFSIIIHRFTDCRWTVFCLV